MPIQPPEETIANWQRAFRDVNGKEAPQMTYSRGWFRRNGVRCGVRESEVIRWTDTLKRRIALQVHSKEASK